MVSMKDIAAACGVSVATVSKALSNHEDIKESTRALIRQKADELGYHPNFSAQYLKTKRSYNIGVLFEDAAGSGLTHDFFAGVLQSFKKEAESRGYDVTFLNTTSTEMSYLERARYRGFDGLAIACFDFLNPKFQELLHSEFRIVTIDYVANGRTAVLSDNEDGMVQLMEHILSKGHRRIAYIYGDASQVTRYRLVSYHKCMQRAGIEVTEQYTKSALYRDIGLSCRLTEELLDLKEPPTCIIYPDDVACFGGINAIRARGLSVPGDISVAGFDGIRAAQYETPRLTTVQQDTEQIGRLAADSLIREIEFPKMTLPDIYKVRGRLLEGETVRELK